MLQRYVLTIIKCPWLVIACILAATVFFGYHGYGLPLRLEPDEQVPPDHPLVMIGQEIQKDFGGKNMALIIVSPKTGTIYTPRVLAKVKTITERALQLKGLRTPGVLSLMSKQVQDIEVTDDQMTVKQFAAQVPETQEDLAAFRKRVETNRTISGMLANRAGTSAMILVDFTDIDVAGGAKGCNPALEAIVASERDPQTDIIVAGMPAMLYWYLIYTERAVLLFFLTLLITAILQYRTFRTFQGMLIPLVTALLGVVWSQGMVGLAGMSLDPWNIMTPILVLAIAAGHSTQILKRYYEEYGRLRATHPELSPRECNREAVIQATTKVGGVMLAAGFIAVLSFGSLLTYSMPSLRGFGLATAFGILASLLMEMTLIPAMRMLLRPPTDAQTAKEKGATWFDPILRAFSRLLLAGKERWIILASLALLAIAFVGALRMDVNNSLKAQFFDSSPLMVDYDRIRGDTNKPFILQVLVDTGKPEKIKDLEVLRRMERLQQFIQNMPPSMQVSHVVSLVDFLKLMNRKLNGDTEAAEVLPEHQDSVGQYLLLYSMNGDKVDMDRFVDFTYSKATMTINLQTDDSKVVSRFIEQVRAEIKKEFGGFPARVEVGGGIAYMLALNEVVIKGKIANLIQISITILVVTSLLLRSFVGGLLVMIPLFCSVLLNFGLMGWLGIWFSMGTAAISATAAGIGADYAIYFIYRMKEEIDANANLRQAAANTMSTSGKAIASVAMAIGTGYLCLTLSGFKLHFLAGVLVAIMMVTSSLGALALLPSLLVKLSPSFLRSRNMRASDAAAEDTAPARGQAA